jgi:hypothetical protein
MSDQRGSTDLIRYLLEELPEDQVEQIEQKYFSSDESFEEVEHAEAELIDLYVSGALQPRQRQKFEKLYLSVPKRRQRVQFAEALRTKASEVPAVSSTFGKSSVATKLLAAAMVIFALAGAWLVRELVRVRAENATAREEIKRLKDSSTSEQQRKKIEELTKELDKARIQEDTKLPQPVHGARPQPSILAVVMNPGLVRDASGMKTLNVTPTIDFIRFELKMDRDPFDAYRVSLQTADGDELWSMGLLRPSNTVSGKTIVFDLPSGRVEPRDYVLLLQGKSSGTKFQNVSAYPFRVRKG